MHTFVLAAVVTILLLCFGGCGAPQVEPVVHHVIIRQSGDVITDVWVLPESDLTYDPYREQWVFTDSNSDSIQIPMDVKVIEIWDRNDLELYHEYHAEFESEPYRFKYNTDKGPC
ncbi:MAG: hypothetical protein ACYS7Y_11680 [Planctomycetota bacterium]